MCLIGITVANRECDWGCLNHMDQRNLWSKCGVTLYCWIFPNCLMYHTNKANTPHPSMQSTQFDEEGVPRPQHRRTRKHTTGPWRLVCSTKTGESTVPVLEYGVRYGAGHIYSDPFFQRRKLNCTAMHSVRLMIPYFFANNNVNYARWIPIHLRYMMVLDEQHPSSTREYLSFTSP